jgi:hypothetical protein
MVGYILAIEDYYIQISVQLLTQTEALIGREVEDEMDSVVAISVA